MTTPSEKPRVIRRFPVLPIGTPTRNGRVYPREVVEKALAARQPDIDARKMLVALHDDTGRLSLSDPNKIGGIVTRAAIEDDQLMVDVEMLATGLGLLLSLDPNIVGDHFEVTPSGTGSVDKDGVVRDDYQLLYFNVSKREEKK